MKEDTKYYGVYDGDVFKASGEYSQCEKYSLDRQLLECRIIEVEPDFDDAVYRYKYLLTEELMECPLTGLEYDFIKETELTRLNNRRLVIRGIRSVLKEINLKEEYKEKYSRLLSQVQEINEIETSHFEEDMMDILRTNNLTQLATLYFDMIQGEED